MARGQQYLVDLDFLALAILSYKLSLVVASCGANIDNFANVTRYRDTGGKVIQNALKTLNQVAPHDSPG